MIPDNESLGAHLKRVREEKKLTVEDIATSLNMKKDVIEAIEADTILDILPPAYARGFIRNYAELLDLDRHAIIERFDMLYRKDTPRVFVRDVGPLKPAERRQRHGKGMMAYLFLVLIIAAVVAAVWYQLHQMNVEKNKKAENETSPNGQEENKDTPPHKDITDEPGKGTMVVPEPVFIISVDVSFTKNTMMKVTVDGTDIYGTGKVFGAGTIEERKAEKSLVLEIDEAANVSISSKGNKLTGLPTKGKVKLTFDEQNKETPRIEAVPLESPL